MPIPNWKKPQELNSQFDAAIDTWLGRWANHTQFSGLIAVGFGLVLLGVGFGLGKSF